VTPDPPQASKRPRKLYILWAIALALLLTASLFCWLVVVPVWQLRAGVWRCYVSVEGYPHIYAEDIAANTVAQLGGGRRAVSTIRWYVLFPDRFAPHPEHAVLMLGFCGEAAVPALLHYLESDDEQTRAFAAAALGRIGDPSAVERLTRLLQDEVWFIRRSGVVALGNIGGPSAVQGLTTAVKDKHADVRRWAVIGLGDIGGPEATAVLESVAGDPDPNVRQAAAEALKKIKDKQAKK
jgi:HEAT repeat protein